MKPIHAKLKTFISVLSAHVQMQYIKLNFLIIRISINIAELLGWSENNFFFEIEKSVVLKTCQTGKINEKNWFWRVATFGGLATPQNVF